LTQKCSSKKKQEFSEEVQIFERRLLQWTNCWHRRKGEPLRREAW
jgi:hypothetical protein